VKWKIRVQMGGRTEKGRGSERVCIARKRLGQERERVHDPKNTDTTLPLLSLCSSQLLSEYFPRGPHQLGHEYKKVVYVEYTDQTFTTRKSPVKRLLGPLLRGQVDEHFQVCTTINKTNKQKKMYLNR
jgi:hypothetical protein